MKKIISLFAALLIVFSFATVSLASGTHEGGHKITGEVVKTKGAIVTVKDKKGRAHKFHVDKTTNLNGKVKMGTIVEVESTDSGHAISMTVKGAE
ncbi:MAG: hypothetical protein ACE5HN_08855 [Nitrospiria bacterium]